MRVESERVWSATKVDEELEEYIVRTFRADATGRLGGRRSSRATASGSGQLVDRAREQDSIVNTRTSKQEQAVGSVNKGSGEERKLHVSTEQQMHDAKKNRAPWHPLLPRDDNPYTLSRGRVIV